MNDKNLDNPNEDFGRSPEIASPTQPEEEKTREQKEGEEQQISEQANNKSGEKPKLAPAKVKRHYKPIPVVQDETVLKIEKILESGLGDQFAKLSPIAKQEFKIKGEETAIKIKDLMQSTHIKIKKILYLIIEWLKILPGVNKFFLEQEAKIKTDLLVELHQSQKNKQSNKLL